MNYYNEWNKGKAARLRALIDCGYLPPGKVDERSITDIDIGDLNGFIQHHFFCGIGGFPFALDIAGWPRTRPIWTGSCPCQPFSNAGKRQGGNDDRHLWPAWFRLIRKQKPVTIIGEQTESAIKHGWLDCVCTDLEAEGYACGPVVLGAHSVGGQHMRQRIFWVADTTAQHGGAYGLLESGTKRGTPITTRRLHCVPVDKGWWEPVSGERLPALVRNYHGLSGMLGGLGDAIIPQVAAEFIAAYMECVA